MASLGKVEAQVERRFRLTRSNDIKRVRHSGRSYTHPLVVLYATTAEQPHSRTAVTAGLKLGGAVQRNRAKRLLRAAMQSFLPDVKPGWDLLLIARSPLANADVFEAREALSALLHRAGILTRNDG